MPCLGVDDHRDAVPEELLVVDQQDADVLGGGHAASRGWWCGGPGGLRRPPQDRETYALAAVNVAPPSSRGAVRTDRWPPKGSSR